MAFETKYQEIRLNQICTRELATEMTEGDVIVPDVQGDIGKVLLVKTSCAIDTKEISGDKVVLSGSVLVHILYSPAEGRGMESIHTSLPFQHTTRIEHEGCFMDASAEVGETSYYLYHSRKMNIKVTVCIRKELSKDVTYQAVTGCTADCETELKYREVPNLEQHICSEQVLAVREQTGLGGSLPDIGRILFYEGKIREPEIRFMTNKAMLQGEIVLSFFYYSIEDTLEFAEHVIPFTEVVDALGVSEEMENNSLMTLSGLQMKSEEDVEGDMRQIFLDAKIRVRIHGERKETVLVAEDLFCTEYPLNCEYGTLSYSDCSSVCSSIAEIREHVLCEDSAAIVKIALLDSAVILCRAEFSGEHTLIEGKNTVSVLYQNSEEEYCSYQKEIPFSCQLEGEWSLADLYARTGHFSYHLLSGTEIEIRGTIYIEGTAEKKVKIPCTTQAEISDNQEYYENRPSLVISFVQPEDTLWEIAKRYSVTRNNIIKANQLENESLLPGQKILIPR